MRNKILLFPALLLLGACVTTHPTAAGQAVKVVENKPSGCKELGKIDTTNYDLNKEKAWNALVNKVVSKGGNTVRIEEERNTSYSGLIWLGSNDYYGYIAYAYNCPVGDTGESE